MALKPVSSPLDSHFLCSHNDPENILCQRPRPALFADPRPSDFFSPTTSPLATPTPRFARQTGILLAANGPLPDLSGVSRAKTPEELLVEHLQGRGMNSSMTKEEWQKLIDKSFQNEASEKAAADIVYAIGMRAIKDRKSIQELTPLQLAAIDTILKMANDQAETDFLPQLRSPEVSISEANDFFTNYPAYREEMLDLSEGDDSALLVEVFLEYIYECFEKKHRGPTEISEIIFPNYKLFAIQKLFEAVDVESGVPTSADWFDLQARKGQPELEALKAEAIRLYLEPRSGTIGFKNGSYDGELKNGVPHGKGRFNYYRGGADPQYSEEYIGNFQNGKRHGKGIYRWDFRKAEVTFVNDVREPKAKIHFGNGVEYEGEIAYGEPDGFGAVDYGNGSKYEGQFKAGERHGKGVFVGKNGLIAQGDFVKDNPVRGKLTYPSGNIYNGPVDSGFRPHGVGSMQYPTGNRYEGNFEHGSVHGDGVYSTPQGYRGEFNYSHGDVVGEGKITYSNGGRYQGAVDSIGRPHGSGVRSFTDGSRIEGPFEKGLPHGQMTYHWSDGRKATLDFVAGDPQAGEGTIEFPDGARYKGHQIEGRPHGKGVTEYANGNRHEGQYAHGLREGPGTYTWPNGKVGTYDFRNDDPHGRGTVIYPSGARYEGEVNDDGRPHGRGGITFSSSDRYEGEFQNGQMQGQGSFNMSDGSRFEGSFEGGRFNSGSYRDSRGQSYPATRHGESIRITREGPGSSSDSRADRNHPFVDMPRERIRGEVEMGPIERIIHIPRDSSDFERLNREDRSHPESGSMREHVLP